MIIIRFRTKDGMFRINAEPKDDFLLVLEQVLSKVKTDLGSLYISNQPQDKGNLAANYCGKTVEGLGLKNGELLFLTYQSVNESPKADSGPSAPKSNGTSINMSGINIPTHSGPSKVKELQVDEILDKKDGLIQRKRSDLCRHTEKGMCEYCSPLPPWDKSYRDENKIKHMSFHAYLNELNETKNNKNNATSYIPPLEEPNYNINLNCPSGHAPYPKGICSKCQPSAITLQQQEFRMIDHVEFSNSSLINDFIDSWRTTGTQRIGYLYGKYELYDKVPLGIKAIVETIYEPPQFDEVDGLRLLDWPEEQKIDEIASKLGLVKVGVIFSDLTDAGKGDGSVLCKRHKDSFFLSSLEVLLAGTLQLKNPNITKYSNSGTFSSKFVTCVISGNLKGEIDISSYQVSTEAEALIKADIIAGSTKPSFSYINSNEGKRYVPDIFYNMKNEYGVTIKKNAKPAFPVDYLLVTATHGFPDTPNPLFRSTKKFAIENRSHMGTSQDLAEIKKQIESDLGDGSSLADFHFVCYIANMDILNNEELGLIIKYITEGKHEHFALLVESPGWQTLLTILRESF